MKNPFELSLESTQDDLKMKLLTLNNISSKFGITITEETALALIQNRNEYLKENERYEFGETILIKLIETFSDSMYIDRYNFLTTIDSLQYMFYHYKNELKTSVSDDELLAFMRKHFDETCHGSLNYLEETLLDGLVREVRGL